MSEQAVEKTADLTEEEVAACQADAEFQSHIDLLDKLTPLFQFSVEATMPYSPGQGEGSALNDPMEGGAFKDDKTASLRERAARIHYRFQIYVMTVAMGM